MRSDPTSAGSTPAEVWQYPSDRFKSMRRVQAIAVTALACLVLLGVSVAAAFAGRHPALAVIAAFFVGLLVAGGVLDRFLQRRVRAWAYCERADDLLVRRGVMVSRLSVVPYGRMQFIDVVSGPFERVYKLATVRLHTAAAASDARIPGLSAESAARLRDHLAALGESNLTGL